MKKEKWVVVLADSSPRADIDDLANYNFDSRIYTRIKFQDDADVLMVPLKSLVIPCYMIANKNHYESNVVYNIYTYSTIFYIVCIMKKWGDMFLPPSDKRG